MSNSQLVTRAFQLVTRSRNEQLATRNSHVINPLLRYCFLRHMYETLRYFLEYYLIKFETEKYIKRTYDSTGRKLNILFEIAYLITPYQLLLNFSSIFKGNLIINHKFETSENQAYLLIEYTTAAFDYSKTIV